ncbi:MAG: ABC transporter permease, partial [Anaerolineae bacterium]|nr:ABC transporter permease [Anaerolineae bacterium]
MNLPYTVIFEKRTEDYPKWLPAITSLGSVVVAFILSGIILEIIGGDSLRVLKFFFTATFGSWGVFSDTIVKATPLIMVGLACAVAFKMKLWNIGAEGQFYMGAFFSSLVVLIPMVDLVTTPKFIVIGLMIVMGMIGGAIWGFIPGYLKAKYRVNEIITTLMLNYIALYW